MSRIPTLASLLLLLSLPAVSPATQPAAHRTSPFLLGADISWTQEDQSNGTTYADQGHPQDLLAILKSHGFNAIRLRLFVNPAAYPAGYAATSKQPFCDLPHTLAMAKQVKAAHMTLLLDFHYSDTWADPGHQFKPAAWRDLDFPSLKQALYDHTHQVLTALKQQNTTPDMVQIGNEVSNGMLWPDGHLPDHYDNFAALLNAGIAATRNVDPKIKIVLHHDNGRGNKPVRAWLDNLLSRNVTDFDIIGLSCNTDGPEAQWQSNFNDLATRYPQYLLIADEYSYRKRALNDIVYNAPDHRGQGTFIWEPTRHHEALFDDAHNQNAGGPPPLPSSTTRPRQRRQQSTTPATQPAQHRPRTGPYHTNPYLNLYDQMSQDYNPAP